MAYKKTFTSIKRKSLEGRFFPGFFLGNNGSPINSKIQSFASWTSVLDWHLNLSETNTSYRKFRPLYFKQSLSFIAVSVYPQFSSIEQMISPMTFPPPPFGNIAMWQYETVISLAVYEKAWALDKRQLSGTGKQNEANRQWEWGLHKTSVNFRENSISNPGIVDLGR